MGVIAAQLIIGILTTIVRQDFPKKDWIIRLCMTVVGIVTIYLLAYFFIYQGCEEMIKFWVLANLLISILFTGLRMIYILAKEGKEGLKNAITK
jgi:RsiW-degrading membrane proteinase PrsW (M82 family)